jgi:C-methyltransferase C-terminal domain
VLEVSSSHKLNRYIPGTHIPVVDQRKLFEGRSEYPLFLSWHVSDELMPILRHAGYEGKFIVPLPEPKIAGN